MKQENYETLKNYEKILVQFRNTQTISCASADDIKTINRILELESKKINPMNINCSRCVFDMLNRVCNMYFSHIDEISKIEPKIKEEPKNEEPETKKGQGTVKNNGKKTKGHKLS